jgi:hypothetical protein
MGVRACLDAVTYTDTENQDYFRDDQNAQRARDWQKDQPGCWKNTARCQRRTLQDGCSEQAPAAQEVAKNASDCTLQDLCSMQVPLFVGLIFMFVGSTLPDDIATSTRRLVIKGHDILGMVPSQTGSRIQIPADSLINETCGSDNSLRRLNRDHAHFAPPELLGSST